MEAPEALLKKVAGALNKIIEEERKLVAPGQKLLEIAERIEGKIFSAGFEPAFPVNIGINNVAAHYTPEIGCEKMLGKDLVNIDLGAHSNGWVIDKAFTLDFTGENSELVKASEKALDRALKALEPGKEIQEVSAEINDEITSRGFKPVSNLTGHGLTQYTVHGYPSIPNNGTGYGVIEPGMLIAIEPFASTGNGFVKEGTQAEIYSLEMKKPVRSNEGRKIIAKAEEYMGLPFAERWIYNKKSISMELGFKELVQRNILRSYPVLKDVEGSLVSQKETTILIKEKGVVVF